MKTVVMAYIISIIIGIVFFVLLPFNDYLNIFLTDITMTLVIWAFSIKFKNSSIYDPYWSLIPIIYILSYAAYKDAYGNISVILLIIIILFWGIRLTINWVKTFKGLDKQDWRYDMFKAKKGWLWSNLFGIHLMPTIFVYLGMIPAFVLIDNGKMSIITIMGFIISIIGIIFEIIADETLHKFKKENSNKICNKSIWNISRHPNYLGEILFWFGIYFVMLGSGFDYWYLIISPIIIMLMFVFISIPMMEKRIGNKEGYTNYKKEVAMLWPYKKRLTKDK